MGRERKKERGKSTNPLQGGTREGGMCERTLGDKKRITSPYAALAKRGQPPNRQPRWPNPLRQEASAKKAQRAKKGEHANRVSSGSSRANTMLVAPRWGKRAFIGVATNCVYRRNANANASANANANKMYFCRMRMQMRMRVRMRMRMRMRT